MIHAGHEIVDDVASDDVIRGICISGVLRFSRDRDTLLNVGLIRIEAGDEYVENGFDCTQAPEITPGPEASEYALGDAMALLNGVLAGS